jgi:hypothetical protein
MAHPHYISARRKFDPCEQAWVTLAQALVWLAYPNDPGRVRDAAPERAGLRRRAQPWEEWTPELDAALTRLLPPHPEKGPLETQRIHACQGDEQVLWTDANLIRIKLRAGNWFVWLAVILTMDPPITLDVADLVETFPEFSASHVEPVAAAPFHKDSSEAPSKRSPMAMTANEAGHMGGTEAQNHRREAGELAWTADALQIAKDARGEDPHIFTKTICERIWNKCTFKGCPAPDEKGNPRGSFIVSSRGTRRPRTASRSVRPIRRGKRSGDERDDFSAAIF